MLRRVLGRHRDGDELREPLENPFGQREVRVMVPGGGDRERAAVADGMSYWSKPHGRRLIGYEVDFVLDRRDPHILVYFVDDLPKM